MLRVKSTSVGFTLIELIVVMIVVGLLAVVALPKLLDQTAFQARGFHDATMAALQFAQKTAVAQRRTVCVAFGSNRVDLTMRTAAADTGCAYAVGSGEIGLGAGGSVYTVSALGSVSYAATPQSFAYSPLGQASVAQTLQIAGETAIAVEADTGFVHSP